MVSRSKLYVQLDLLESELKEKIIPHLQKAAEGKSDLVFCVEEFNPYSQLKYKTDKKTEYLVSIGAQILVLKKKLGEPTKGIIAERICWYCREWGNLINIQANSAQDLAKLFLDEIKKWK